jgi:hypothetical protein
MQEADCGSVFAEQGLGTCLDQILPARLELKIAKTAALIIVAVILVAVVGWSLAPDWFRSGFVDYVQESGLTYPVQTYERWRVSRAGYNYGDVLGKCSRAGEGNISLAETITIRDAEYVVDAPQVRVKGNKIVADVPMQMTTGNAVIPTQHHCEYDISTGAVVRSETLRVKH